MVGEGLVVGRLRLQQRLGSYGQQGMKQRHSVPIGCFRRYKIAISAVSLHDFTQTRTVAGPYTIPWRGVKQRTSMMQPATVRWLRMAALPTPLIERQYELG